MTANLDPTVDNVTVYVLGRDAQEESLEYEVTGEDDAITLIRNLFVSGVSITIAAKEDAPEEIWDTVVHIPPHRIVHAEYMKRNSKPRPPEWDEERHE